MSTKKTKKRIPMLFLLILATPLSFAAPKPAQANPFKGLFSGIFNDLKGTGSNIIKGSFSNPVGTFRILNDRVFGIEGTEKYLQYYDKYQKYLKYVPGLGGQPLPASTAIDIVAEQAGLENGLPRDLNSILDEILGPSKTATNPDGSSGCFAVVAACNDGEYTTILDQIQKESAVASTGPMGIPDIALVRKTVTEAAKRGANDDRLLSNPIVAANYTSNETDRSVVRAKAQATLGEQGQQNSLDTIVAIDEGLTGVVDTAKEGLDSKITQEVVKSLLSVTTQGLGFQAIGVINSEQEKIDRALQMNQLANHSQTQDAIRRAKDVQDAANTNRLIKLSRKTNRY